MTDIHSHIIFGVDDGAQSPEDSFEMLQAAKKAGISKIVATPHARGRVPDFELVKMNFAKTKKIAGDIGMDMVLGYECNINMLNPKNISDISRFRVEGTNTLLFELPFDVWPENWSRIIYDIQSAGLDIIIAHPERYRPIRRDLKKLDELEDLGCLFQINAGSILKNFGERARVVKYIKKIGKVDFIASDAHSPEAYIQLGQALKKAGKYMNYDWN